MDNIIEKHFVQGSGIDAGTLALLKDGCHQPGIAEMMAMCNNGGGIGGNNGMLWIFLLLLFGQGNGGIFGNRNGGNIPTELNNDYNTDLLMQALNGNRESVSQLATNLNCDLGRIEQTIGMLSGGIDKIAGEVKFTSSQVINAVQSGDASIVSKLQECCCSTQRSIDAVNLNITKMSYEDQLAVQAQTNTLTSALNAGFAGIGNQIVNQTTTMQAGFQGVKDLFTQQKIDTLQAANSAYSNQLSNLSQTTAIRDLIEPIRVELATIKSEIPTRPEPAFPVSPYYPYSPYVAPASISTTT